MVTMRGCRKGLTDRLVRDHRATVDRCRRTYPRPGREERSRSRHSELTPFPISTPILADKEVPHARRSAKPDTESKQACAAAFYMRSFVVAAAANTIGKVGLTSMDKVKSKAT